MFSIKRSATLADAAARRSNGARARLARVGGPIVLDTMLRSEALVARTPGELYRDGYKRFGDIAAASFDPEALRKVAQDGRDAQKQAEKDALQHYDDSWNTFGGLVDKSSDYTGLTKAMILPAMPLIALGRMTFKNVVIPLGEWAFGTGKKFDEKYIDLAQRYSREISDLGFPPMAWDEKFVSPGFYAEEIEKDVRQIGATLRKEGYLDDGMDAEEWPKMVRAVYTWGSVDPAILEDWSRLATVKDEWGAPLSPIRYARKLADGRGAQQIAEMVSLAAAHDAGVPYARFAEVVGAGQAAWDPAIDDAETYSIPRGELYAGCGGKGAECDALISMGGAALATIRAWRAAKRKAAEIVGRGEGEPAPVVPRSDSNPFPDGAKYASLAGSALTVQRLVAASAASASAASARSVASTRSNATVPLTAGAIGSGALALAGTGLLVAAAPLGLALLWVIMSRSDGAAAASTPAVAKTALARVGLDVAAEHEHDDSVDDGGLCPFNLHDADASRYKCWEDLLALEDHVVGDWCPDCASKHVGAAIKFLREARSLYGGSDQDVRDARALVAMCPRLRDSLDDLRALRKSIGERIGVRRIVEENGLYA